MQGLILHLVSMFARVFKVVNSAQDASCTDERQVMYFDSFYCVAMSSSRPDSHAERWTTEDFIDQTRPSVMEDDPWSGSPKDDRMEGTCDIPAKNQSFFLDVENGYDENLTDVDDSGQTTESVSEDQYHGHQPATASEGTTGTGVLNDVDWVDDLDPVELENEPSIIDDELYIDALSYFNDSEDDPGYLDEPEPLAEYDGDLAEPLYNQDGDIANLSQKLSADEVIARIECATNDERTQISAMLSEFGSRKLSKWTPWLKGKKWTGQSLLIFLEFLDLWNENPQWWEYSVWSQWLDRWWTYSNSGVLSRDACYDLIHHRLQYEPENVIDETWLKDWDDLALWKRGFHSFASFAVFRAGLSEADDWRDHVSPHLVDELDGDSRPIALYRTPNDYDSHSILFSLIGGYSVWEDTLLHKGRPLWFAVQDWYDPVEWHDNLGWACTWVEAEHPYLSDESFSSL